MNSDIDRSVTEAAHQFVAELGKLNDDPYIRDAVMRVAIREVVWAMLKTFNNQDALSEQLETMSDQIREHKPETEGKR
jgi:hypothetical protein